LGEHNTTEQSGPIFWLIDNYSDAMHKKPLNSKRLGNVAEFHQRVLGAGADMAQIYSA
jgi:hypothetical protein